MNVAISLITLGNDILSEISEEESNSLNSLSENLEFSSLHDELDENVNNIDEAISQIDDGLCSIESVSGGEVRKKGGKGKGTKYDYDISQVKEEISNLSQCLTELNNRIQKKEEEKAQLEDKLKSLLKLKKSLGQSSLLLETEASLAKDENKDPHHNVVILK